MNTPFARLIQLFLALAILVFACGCSHPDYLRLGNTETMQTEDSRESVASPTFINFTDSEEAAATEVVRYDEIVFTVIRLTDESGEVTYTYAMEHDSDKEPCEALDKVIETAKGKGCDDVNSYRAAPTPKTNKKPTKEIRS